ncbi:MAG: hypothetical protein AAB421_02610 [Patescibacteria group bacterium]
MHLADERALATLAKLQRTRSQPPTTFPYTPLRAGNGVLVGFEIEVPWRAYFPDLWKKYLCAGSRTFSDLSRTEQSALSNECSLQERSLLPRLQATQACGIKRGRDHYWEFAFPPVHDLTIALCIMDSLIDAELLPWGRWSLQATISGVKPGRDAFVALLLLELLFVRKVRIQQGLSGHGAWARKGRGGLMVKGPHLLEYNAPSALELRSLELPETLGECRKLFATIAHLTHFLTPLGMKAPEWQSARSAIKEMLASHDLPFSEWGHPKNLSAVWDRYIEHFDVLRTEALHIARNHLGIAISTSVNTTTKEATRLPFSL